MCSEEDLAHKHSQDEKDEPNREDIWIEEQLSNVGLPGASDRGELLLGEKIARSGGLMASSRLTMTDSILQSFFFQLHVLLPHVCELLSQSSVLVLDLPCITAPARTGQLINIACGFRRIGR